jgi:hypothetical protein
VILRLFLFILAAAGGYVLTVVAAFVFWSWTGASGPNPNPLLAVLFIIAPAVALCCGLFAAIYPARRAARRHGGEARFGDDREARDIPPHWRREEKPDLPRRYGSLQIAIIIICALLIGAILGATGFGTHYPFGAR